MFERFYIQKKKKTKKLDPIELDIHAVKTTYKKNHLKWKMKAIQKV